MRNEILLFVNGLPHRIGGGDAFLTLSGFLRERLNLCGTKIVCSEGDCGSCSVLCGKIDSPCVAAPNANRFNEISYRAIDSCIRFVFQLDGCHIVTIEGLNNNASQKGTLTGVQQAMIDCHGSQCGFCTPGFVVAMTGVLEHDSQPTEVDWRHGLTGNLCRCTGYSPIIRAGLQSNSNNTLPLNRCFAAAPMIAAYHKVRNDEIQIKANSPNEKSQTVYSPTTITQACAFLANYPTAKIVAGATDVGVQFNKGVCQSENWLDLNRIDELSELKTENGHIIAGARASWQDFEKLTLNTLSQFHRIVSVFGSPQIRTVGTIGGNIINASPIADSIPLLMVCNAELELTSLRGQRSVNINHFYQGYKEFDLRAGELLTRIRIPLLNSQSQLRLYKISRRRDLDISSFTAAIAMELTQDTIKTAAIAMGAVGPVVLRLPKTETFLTGQPFSLSTMHRAGEIAVTEITPISDVRGGAEYRIQLAKNVLLKFFQDVQIA